MNLYVVVGVKENSVEHSGAFLNIEEAITDAWRLIKEELFFEEFNDDNTPFVPEENPFIVNDYAENDEGSVSVSILTFVI